MFQELIVQIQKLTGCDNFEVYDSGEAGIRGPMTLESWLQLLSSIGSSSKHNNLSLTIRQKLTRRVSHLFTPGNNHTRLSAYSPSQVGPLSDALQYISWDHHRGGLLTDVRPPQPLPLLNVDDEENLRRGNKEWVLVRELPDGGPSSYIVPPAPRRAPNLDLTHSERIGRQSPVHGRTRSPDSIRQRLGVRFPRRESRAAPQTQDGLVTDAKLHARAAHTSYHLDSSDDEESMPEVRLIIAGYTSWMLTKAGPSNGFEDETPSTPRRSLTHRMNPLL